MRDDRRDWIVGGKPLQFPILRTVTPQGGPKLQENSIVQQDLQKSGPQIGKFIGHLVRV